MVRKNVVFLRGFMNCRQADDSAARHRQHKLYLRKSENIPGKIMNEDSKKKKSIFYISLSELLDKRMPEIHKGIEKAITYKDYSDVIESIECSLEKHIWGQDTHWRIYAEVDAFPCDDTGRPFGLGGYVLLEEVKGRETVYFQTQMYNSFDEQIVKQEKIKIHYDMLDNNEFVESIIQQTNEFLDQFYDKFMTGADIFVREWRVLKSNSDWSDFLVEWEKEKKKNG